MLTKVRRALIEIILITDATKSFVNIFCKLLHLERQETGDLETYECEKKIRQQGDDDVL